MQAVSADQGAWLKAKADEAPMPGTDTLVATHYPNISAAFGEVAARLKDGEGLVFRPAPGKPPSLIGRIKIEDWPQLATADGIFLMRKTFDSQFNGLGVQEMIEWE